ncbi:MAG: HpcH/HpaI aldolase family protein [Christensenellales bacterium]|jgi:2-keto-3-deoxy-L-rhamnonate aldolase RhmA
MDNLVKTKISEGKTVFGPWIETGSVDNAEILAHVGFDMIMVDGEHGAMSLETAGKLISHIKSTDTVPLIRVPGNDIWVVKQGLDAGPKGIMIPMINSKEEAELAIQYCTYPPRGVRGVGTGRACVFGNKLDEYVEFTRTGLIKILQIEHFKAVEDIDGILSVDGIDVAFLGPYDLSLSMGIMGDMNHPDMHKAFVKVLDACKRHNVTPGIMTSPGMIQKHAEMGFRFLLGGVDSMLLFNAAKSCLEEFQGVQNR